MPPTLIPLCPCPQHVSPSFHACADAEAMWAANKLDIEATLRHVCRRLLEDEEVGARCVAVGLLARHRCRGPAGRAVDYQGWAGRSRDATSSAANIVVPTAGCMPPHALPSLPEALPPRHPLCYRSARRTAACGQRRSDCWAQSSWRQQIRPQRRSSRRARRRQRAAAAVLALPGRGSPAQQSSGPPLQQQQQGKG